jgi:hypothetical protein
VAAVEDGDVVTTGGEAGDDVTADEAGAAEDQDPIRHGRAG